MARYMLTRCSTMRPNMSSLTRRMTRASAILAIFAAACSEPGGRDIAGFMGFDPGTTGLTTTSDHSPTSSEGSAVGGSTNADVITTGDTTGNGETTTGADSTSGDSTSNDAGTTGSVCNDVPGTLVGSEYKIGPTFAEQYGIYDLGDVPGVEGLLGGSVISSSAPDILLIVGTTGFPPARLFEIGLTRGACGHITGFTGVAQPIADVPQATSVMFARNDLLLLTTHPSSLLYQLVTGETIPSDIYDFDVMKEVQHVASGIAIVPASYGLPVPTLCFSSYPSGAFTCGEIKDKGPLVELSGLKQMSTYAMVGNGFAYVPDDIELPGFAPHSLIGSGTPFNGIFVYRCDDDGIPISESRETLVDGDAHNVSIDPVAGDVLISALRVNYSPGDVPFNHLLIVRPRTLIAN